MLLALADNASVPLLLRICGQHADNASTLYMRIDQIFSLIFYSKIHPLNMKWSLCHTPGQAQQIFFPERPTTGGGDALVDITDVMACVAELSIYTLADSNCLMVDASRQHQHARFNITVMIQLPSLQ